MTDQIVAAAADSDSIVRTGAAYRRKILYPLLRRCGFRVCVLAGEEARKQQVDEAMKKPEVRLFTGLGHGNAEEFTGQDQLPLYSADEAGTAVGIKGRIFHLCSCSTARRLGPALLEAGASAFFGYATPVLVNFDQPRWLYDADSEIDIALASGATCAEALARSKAAFEQAIHEAEANDSPLGVRALFAARVGLRGPNALEPNWGDPDATL
ncbi:MAG TPA: hypothetical protein VGS07_05915 [Thermoanaerobaculia bacterium]|jgi:hypothetical protein|nr:hypothetical protein [Thermoanaerobaculia bacterium]